MGRKVSSALKKKTSQIKVPRVIDQLYVKWCMRNEGWWVLHVMSLKPTEHYTFLHKHINALFQQAESPLYNMFCLTLMVFSYRNKGQWRHLPVHLIKWAYNATYLGTLRLSGVVKWFSELWKKYTKLLLARFIFTDMSLLGFCLLVEGKFVPHFNDF